MTGKDHEERFDFVIVGSGAGGGPLAANLVEAGFRVLLLEAGTGHQCDYYEVPVMQARASEDRNMRWDFFMRHYKDDEQRRRDSKFVAEEDAVYMISEKASDVLVRQHAPAAGRPTR